MARATKSATSPQLSPIGVETVFLAADLHTYALLSALRVLIYGVLERFIIDSNGITERTCVALRIVLVFAVCS